MSLREDLLARWRKLPVGLRYGLEAFGVRLVVCVALALVAMRVLDVTGYLASLRAGGLIPPISIQLISFPSFQTYEQPLSVDQVLFTITLTLLASAAFSPWRAPSLLLGLIASAILLVSFPYTRLTLSFVRQLPLLGGLVPETFSLRNQQPTFALLAWVMLAMAVVVGFAALEGGRALRRAYEEKGVAPRELRSLGTLQLGATAVVLAGAFAVTALLSFVQKGFDFATRGPLPRVNPVVTFLVMGLFLGVAIVAFAWKPDPAQDAGRPTLRVPTFRRKAP